MLREERSPLEPVLSVLYQFPEIDHQTPWEGPMHVQSLEQNLADLLLNQRVHLLSLLKQPEQDLTELVRMAIGIAQLVHDAVQEAESRLIVQFYHHALYEVEVLSLAEVGGVLGSFSLAVDGG